MFYGISEDIACVLIARNELRKNGLTPSLNPGEFLSVFHSFNDDKKGVSDAERKRNIVNYLDNSELAIKKNVTVKDPETQVETTQLTVVGIRKD